MRAEGPHKSPGQASPTSAALGFCINKFRSERPEHAVPISPRTFHIHPWYFILFLQPKKFAAAIPYFGWLMIIEGLILLIHGLRLHLPAFPFYADTAACLLGGSGVLYFSTAARVKGD